MRAGALSPLSRENTRAVGWKSFIHTVAPAGEEAGDQGPSEVGANAWSKRSLCPSPARMRPASYLNIGYHKVECSLSEIVQLILWHRPDVLFLGDLGVVHNKIGRLKQRMESSLGDEWFMLTDISPYNKRGGPVGRGRTLLTCKACQNPRPALPGRRRYGNVVASSDWEDLSTATLSRGLSAYLAVGWCLSTRCCGIQCSIPCACSGRGGTMK